MNAEDFEEKRTQYEKVLDELRARLDEKIHSGRSPPEINPDEDDLTSVERDHLIQNLIVLGEVELCQERATGGRVWLKRCEDPDEETRREVISESVWHGYVAHDYREQKADRLFTSRESAMIHLVDSAVVEASDFEPLSFLEDVWVAPAYKERKEMTSVVRLEPIYRLWGAEKRLKDSV